jgi:hypothetical protein
MMKSFGMIIFLLLISACSGLAQEDNSSFYFVNAGLAIPLAPKRFADNWNTGLNFGGGFIKPVAGFLDLTGGLTYSRFGFNSGGITEYPSMGVYVVDTKGGATSIVAFCGGLRFSFVPSDWGKSGIKAMPYLAFGASAFWLFQGSTTINYLHEGQIYTHIQNGAHMLKPGLFAGAGLQITLNDATTILVGAGYIVGLTPREGTAFLPIQLGLALR